MAKYLWQKPNWKKFSWDSEKILPILSKARKAQGYLLAQAEKIELKDLSEFITEEALKTSEIEGEKIDVRSLRSSVAKQLGLPTAGMVPSTTQSDGLIEILLDAVRNFEKKLNKKRICGWQAALFPTGYSGIHQISVGNYRKGNEPMRVVSGGIDKIKVHYEAPPSKAVPCEMKTFLSWWNSSNDLDGIIRAAIAHLWFVAIHPFDDGNGRVTRAITDMALAQDERTSLRLYSLSSQIMKDRKNYYEILERSQKGEGDITEWIVWFLSMFLKAIEKSKAIIKKTLTIERFYKRIAGIELNERQSKIIRKLLDRLPDEFEGGLTNKKYVSIAKTSPETAKRDIKDLVEKKILLMNDGRGRSTSYRLHI